MSLGAALVHSNSGSISLHSSTNFFVHWQVTSSLSTFSSAAPAGEPGAAGEPAGDFAGLEAAGEPLACGADEDDDAPDLLASPSQAGRRPRERAMTMIGRTDMWDPPDGNGRSSIPLTS